MDAENGLKTTAIGADIINRPIVSKLIPIVLGGLVLSSAAVHSQTSPPASTASTGLTIELNKLEPLETSCRAYFVADNQSDKSYSTLKIDFVIFQSDGVIARRVTLELAPLKATKQSVKQFDFDGLGCDKVGRMLINEVIECKADADTVADCQGKLVVKSLVNGISLTK